MSMLNEYTYWLITQRNLATPGTDGGFAARRQERKSA